MTSRDHVFCPACRDAGKETVLRLESVGFLQKLRAASYVCPDCGHATASSLRRAAFRLPEPDVCWSCGVPHDGEIDACPSCGVHPVATSDSDDGVFHTYEAAELSELIGLGADELRDRIAVARAEQQFVAALRAADALTRSTPHDASAWRLKAELLLERGFLVLALAGYKRALVLTPDDPEIWLAFANVLDVLEEPSEAEAVLALAAADLPDDPRPWALLASLRDKLGRHDDAASSARRAVAIDPTWADAWATLATGHMRKKEFDAAIDAWDRVLGVTPDSQVAWRYKGMCHLYSEQWHDAAVAGEHAGQDDEALELVFEARLNGGDGDAALAAARRAIELRPGQSRFLYLEARAHMARESYADGIEVMDRILELEPGAGWAKQARAQLTDKLDGGAARP